MTKLVCISGCSRGLGRAMAIEFSSRGWTVAGGARSIDALEGLSKQIDTNCLFLPMDVSDPESV